MTMKTIDDIAAEIPVWRVLAEKFKGIDATVTYPDGGEAAFGSAGVEIITFPNGDGPPDDALVAARTELAVELYARQHVDPRAAAFAEKSVGDQLDSLIKGFKAARNAGVDLPDDTDALINWSDQIKAAYPKPPSAEPTLNETSNG
jgi:hypothetical protein